MSQRLYDAVKENNLAKLKEYLNNPHFGEDIFFHNNDLLMFAAGTNAVDVVDFLLTSPEILIHSDDSHKSKCILSNNINCSKEHDGLECIRVADFAKEKALVTACTYGCFPTIRYLLTCEKFSTPIDIHYNNEEALATACRGSQPTIAQYLLTCQKLKERASINAYGNRALRWAFRSSLPNENMVKYLLTSTKLKEHASIYDNNCQPFFELVNTPSNCKEGVWNYLVFEYKIKILPPIKEFMDKNPNHIASELLFKRELHNNLDSELSVNPNCKQFSKTKI
jgi:hypothetical protein